MNIDRLDLRLLRLPLAHFFETSFGRVHDRTFLLVARRRRRAGGLGRGASPKRIRTTARRPPRRRWHIITEFLAPRVLGQTFEHPREVFPAMARVRGHNMAKAGIEMAAWDLYARILRPAALGGARRHARPHRLGRLDRHPGLARPARGEGRDGTRRRLPAHQDQDQARLGPERRRGASARSFPTSCSWSMPTRPIPPTDGAHLAKLDPYKLMMIEQPLEYDDMMDHVQLQKEIATPICLDESIHTVRIAPRRHRGEGLPDHQRQAGPRRRARRVDHAPRPLRRRTASRCGTAACSSRASAARTTSTWPSLPNFTLPGDIAASKRYYEPDLIEPGIEVVARRHHPGADGPRHRREHRRGTGAGGHRAPDLTRRHHHQGALGG